MARFDVIVPVLVVVDPGQSTAFTADQAAAVASAAVSAATVTGSVVASYVMPGHPKSGNEHIRWFEGSPGQTGAGSVNASGTQVNVTRDAIV